MGHTNFNRHPLPDPSAGKCNRLGEPTQQLGLPSLPLPPEVLPLSLAPVPFPLGKALRAMSQLQHPRKVPEGGTCQRKSFTPNPGQKDWAQARNMGWSQSREGWLPKCATGQHKHRARCHQLPS